MTLKRLRNRSKERRSRNRFVNLRGNLLRKVGPTTIPVTTGMPVIVNKLVARAWLSRGVLEIYRLRIMNLNSYHV